jgi:hypothetical protein
MHRPTNSKLVGPQSHTPYSCSQAPHTRGHMLFNGYWERQTEFMDFLSRFNCPAAWLHPEFSITMDPLRIYFRSHRYRTSWMKIPAQLGKIRQKCLELSRHHADYYIIFFRTLHTVFFFFWGKLCSLHTVVFIIFEFLVLESVKYSNILGVNGHYLEIDQISSAHKTCSELCGRISVMKLLLLFCS